MDFVADKVVSEGWDQSIERYAFSFFCSCVGLISFRVYIEERVLDA